MRPIFYIYSDRPCKHRFADKVWKDPKVVTKSNCPACHRGADQGWYEDD